MFQVEQIWQVTEFPELIEPLVYPCLLHKWVLLLNLPRFWPSEEVITQTHPKKEKIWKRSGVKESHSLQSAAAAADAKSWWGEVLFVHRRNKRKSLRVVWQRGSNQTGQSRTYVLELILICLTLKNQLEEIASRRKIVLQQHNQQGGREKNKHTSL